MIFTRIIYSAVVIGMLCGLLLSLMQVLAVDPIIFEAESFEIVQPEKQSEGHEGHDHSHQGWAPEDGVERTFYTILSNMSAAIGFAAVLLALMSQIALPKQQRIKPMQGLLWGGAGFVALYLAPGLGLPPEIPGIEAVSVEHRQVWWFLTVISVAIGLGILALARLPYKAIGLVFLAIPYLVGAPQHEGALFLHPDPAAVDMLLELHQRFIIISGVINLLFWALLGLACAYAFNRWLQTATVGDEHPA